ncbi:MAG: amidohydrolase [Balneolales bacterium]
MASCSQESNDNIADLIVVNGRILTVDQTFSDAEAVAIRDGIFIAVGSNDEVEPYIGTGTTVIDAAGKTVIPGLIETHTHATRVVSRELASGVPFEQLNSIEEIQNWLREQANQTPAGQWIRIPRAEVTRIREGRIPTSAELEEAAPDHPAVFIWQYADRQIQVLNPAAMAAADITADTQAPPGGRIVVDEYGEPIGRLEDSGILTERFLRQHEYSEEEYMNGLERLFGHYNRMGITSIHDNSTDEEAFRIFNIMQDEGRLNVRVTLTMRMEGLDGTVEGTESVIRNFNLQYREGNDWVRVGSLKFRMDGGILYGTAYMRDPFGETAFDLYGIDDPDYRGTPFFDPQEVENIIYAGHKSGWQISTHVTGDAGVDVILDAIESINHRLDEDQRIYRFRLIHAYFAHQDAADRIRKLGAGVDTQPAWYRMDADALVNALGDDRMQRFIGLDTWNRAGVKITINSDHMMGYDANTSLNPWNPFLTLYTAISRRTTGGEVIGPDQRISREDALRMMTIDAAWFDFSEDRRGSIEAGKLGDLAIISNDLMNCDEEEIADIRSLLTVVGGKIVYVAEQSGLFVQRR